MTDLENAKNRIDQLLVKVGFESTPKRIGNEIVFVLKDKIKEDYENAIQEYAALRKLEEKINLPEMDDEYMLEFLINTVEEMNEQINKLKSGVHIYSKEK